MIITTLQILQELITVVTSTSILGYVIWLFLKPLLTYCAHPINEHTNMNNK